MQRRHLCTCLEREAPSVWLALGADKGTEGVMIQSAIWTLFSWEWGAWKDFKLGGEGIRFAFQKDSSVACKGVNLEGARLETGDQ